MNNYLSLTDHVYNYIVDQINSGKLISSNKVNESAISEALKVSRTPVREALIQLSSEGLLENIPRKGFVIKSLTKEEAKETFFIIGSLDGLAAVLSTPLLTEKHMKEMDFYIESIDLAINTANHKESADKIRLSAKKLGMELIELKEAFRGSEDFGHFTKLTKGAYCFIGNGKEYPNVHTSEYDFRDELIESGVALFKELTKI